MLEFSRALLHDLGVALEARFRRLLGALDFLHQRPGSLDNQAHRVLAVQQGLALVGGDVEDWLVSLLVGRFAPQGN